MLRKPPSLLFCLSRNLWYQIVAFPVVEAPRFTNGQIATIVTAVASVVIAMAILYCQKKWPPPQAVALSQDDDSQVLDEALSLDMHTTEEEQGKHSLKG